VEIDRYNEQTMIQYLLSSLPTEETERFDELCFIDDEFSARLSAVENDLVDRYVNGGLSGENLARFNSYYLASPIRRRKVQTAQAFQTLAGRMAATGQLALAPSSSQTAAASKKLLPRLTFLSGFLSYSRLLLTSAAVMALAGAGWMVVELSRLREQVDRAQTRVITLERREKELQELLQEANSATEKELERLRKEKDLVERQLAMERQIAQSQSPGLPVGLGIISFKLPAPIRSSDQVLTISTPPGTGTVVLEVELEPDDYPSYNAVLLTQEGRKFAGWRRNNLKSKAMDGGKILEIVIPASRLKSKAYLLEVTGASRKGVVEGERVYPFRVEKQ